MPLPSALSLLLLTLAPPSLPEPPPGSGEWYLQTVAEVRRDLAKGSFSSAAQKAGKLPDATLSVQYDDRAVPAAKRPAYKVAFDQAIADWKGVISSLKVAPAKVPDVLINFAATLPPNPDSSGPAGAVFFTSTAPNDPSVEGVIALFRGTEKREITPVDVYNETVFAIGTHFGFARAPRAGSAMFRSDVPMAGRMRPNVLQGGLAAKNFELTQKLRAAAKAKQKVPFAVPKLLIQPDKVVAKPVGQGDDLSFSIQITNQGTAPLRYSMVPDCSCFSIRQSAPVEPGSTIAVPVKVDTVNFGGVNDKLIFLYTNDPDHSLKVIPVRFEVIPRYKFLWNEKVDVLQVDDSGRVVHLYLAVDPNHPMKIKGIDFNGVAGAGDFEPYTGPLPWDSKVQISGYKLELLFGPNIGEGRKPVTLQVLTDDPDVPEIRYSFYLQRGIAASPGFVYLGEIGKGSLRATSIVSRPGKPFKVTKIESDNGLFTAKLEPLSNPWEYRIVILYKGGGPIGELEANIKVHTDDPKQSVVNINVTGVVK